MLARVAGSVLTVNRATAAQGFIAGRFWPRLPGRSDLGQGCLEALAQGVAVNSKAELGQAELADGRPTIIGNQTEGALLAYLRFVGVDYRAQRSAASVVRTFAFSSAKKRMSTLVRCPGGGGRLLVKGAPEALLDASRTYVAHDGSELLLGAQIRAEVDRHLAAMAGDGLRTIALALAEVNDVESAAALSDPPPEGMPLQLIAVIGIRDPPRKVMSALSRIGRFGVRRDPG